MEVWGGNQAADRNFETPGLRIWVYSRPFGEAVGGGDVYYFSSCASGRITRMLLADVSGHGEKVSHTAVVLRELMRRNVNFVRQTRFVRAMNEQFTQSDEHVGFATALVCTYFAPTQMFSLSNAGHPLPLVYHRGDFKWTEIAHEHDRTGRVADMPLGIIDKTRYNQRQFRLEVGDMVLCFSDSVTESIDEEGHQLGATGVLDIVRRLNVSSPHQIISALIQKLTERSPENLQQDDTTIFLFQATGSRSTIRDNLLAPFRLFRPVSDQTTVA